MMKTDNQEINKTKINNGVSIDYDLYVGVTGMPPVDLTKMTVEAYNKENSNKEKK